MTQVCDDCGKIIAVGEWPWCPHDRGASMVVPDDIPGGMVVENGFDEPIRVYSHSEHERLLAKNGCEIRAKHAGPADKIMIDWAAGIDAQTLANAATLLTRGSQARRAKADRWKGANATITAVDGESFTRKDVERAD